MSNNKSVVHTTQSLLKSLNIEVKKSEIYETYSRLCGFSEWNVAHAKGLEFSPLVQERLKAELLNKANSMTDSQWQKYVIKTLLDPIDHEYLYNVELFFKKNPISIENAAEVLDLILSLKSNLAAFRELAIILAEQIVFASVAMKNLEFKSYLNENKNKMDQLSRDIEPSLSAFKNKQFKESFIKLMDSLPSNPENYKFDGVRQKCSMTTQRYDRFHTVLSANVDFHELLKICPLLEGAQDSKVFITSAIDENKRFGICLMNDSKNSEKVKVSAFIVLARYEQWEFESTAEMKDVAQFCKAFNMSEIEPKPQHYANIKSLD
jgi:6-pyruvoyl-tetrahydropterin synthase